MRRARRARHAWRDERGQSRGGARSRGRQRTSRRAGAGIMSRYMCGEQPPPRAAGRPGQRIKSLSSHRAPFVYRGTAPGQRARVCRRHDAHVVRFRGALHHQYTGNTTATASGGSPRPVNRTPVNRPRGRPVRVRRARALIDGRDSEHRPMFTDDYHLPTRNSGPWMANRQSHATACHLGSRDISGRMSIIRRPGAASLDIGLASLDIGRLVTAPRFCRPVTPRRSRRRARRALHGAARA